MSARQKTQNMTALDKAGVCHAAVHRIINYDSVVEENEELKTIISKHVQKSFTLKDSYLKEYSYLVEYAENNVKYEKYQKLYIENIVGPLNKHAVACLATLVYMGKNVEEYNIAFKRNRLLQVEFEHFLCNRFCIDYKIMKEAFFPGRPRSHSI